MLVYRGKSDPLLRVFGILFIKKYKFYSFLMYLGNTKLTVRYLILVGDNSMIDNICY